MVEFVLLCLYSQVKRRTASDNFAYGSHVMQYGDIEQSKEALVLYLGTNPANENYTYVDDNSLRPATRAVKQRDADLLHFWHKVFLFFSRTLLVEADLHRFSTML